MTPYRTVVSRVRSVVGLFKQQGTHHKRYLSNTGSPFQDDLTDFDMDEFGLGDFRHYKESPEVAEYKRNQIKSVLQDEEVSKRQSDSSSQLEPLESVATTNVPAIFISKLTDPYLNLAIEDYVYNKIPISKSFPFKAHRLMFYTNSPCVVIGKNQNPWKEVNLPTMNSQFGIPLIRRRSGGGTVVHDLGNVNYSFMTTKQEFDRFKFVQLIVDVINGAKISSTKIKVNHRGDIVTTQDKDGDSGGATSGAASTAQELKISGSAYKLSRGKSYHHGTMLLNSDLDRLKQVLHRDVTQLGVVDTSKTIDSVRAKVTNLQIPQQSFIELVSSGFKFEYGISDEAGTTTVETPNCNDTQSNEDDFDEINELMKLGDFAHAAKLANVFQINDSIALPKEVISIANELKSWEWKYGRTPLFTHTFESESLNICVKFTVDKGVIETVEFVRDGDSQDNIELLHEMSEKLHGVQYRGDTIEKALRGDEFSRKLGSWLHSSIDGV
ncbi:hypothetical protein KGF57_000344 [Candida theae]|uniref:Putative lipoate-protein ligase A n=1 Tax=Candida theae TaxID=1198502 RepID=A0AAD5G0Q4_9ASCO|nr:uncharacterized protein KGF57_000344 [Candida theae]KAI5967504.1 hypothetical protein KGF57_000344 [Candida theae]